METVILKTFDNYFSANITLTKLQDAGVLCYLKDEYTVTIDPILSNAIGGIKLAVDIRHAQLAQELLKQYHEEYMRSAACPKCQEHSIILVPANKPLNVFTAIVSWLISSYAVSAEDVYRCTQCGYESTTLPADLTEYN